MCLFYWFTTKHYSQIHLCSLAWSYRLSSFLLPRSFLLMELLKIELAFWFQNWFDVYLKQHFDILLVEWEMNQATPSSRRLNSKPKYMDIKNMNSHPHTMTLEPGVLNICIMVCSGSVVHRLMKCISLQSPKHHIRWDQSLLILIIYAWIEKRPSLLSLSHSKNECILCGPFLSRNKFSFMKNPN